MMITSLQNPLLKSVLRLRESKDRRKQNQFLVEGFRENQRAIANGFTPEMILMCERYLSDECRGLIKNHKQVLLDEKCFDRLVVRKGSQGIVGVYPFQERTIESLTLSKDATLLMIEGLEKPGNIGGLLRSADGAGVAAVLILDERCDLYNPNLIRASLGTVFALPVVRCSQNVAFDFCKREGFTTYAAALLPGAQNYDRVTFAARSAILMGTEASGLSSSALSRATHPIIIPMKGSADSLNVSVAGAILLYEVLRQKNA